MKFRMNSPQGKAILALVRGGDYAHPGEEAVLARVAQALPREAVHRLLDVGCGRGGTADWFVRHGWGTVVGVDIDGESIEYARHRYGGVTFAQADVLALPQLQQEPFDLACLFNSFYAFSDQPAALTSLRKVCRCGACLLIFDYTKPPDRALPEVLGTEIGQPIVLESIAAQMTDANWQLSSVEDWTESYLKAYSDFLARVRTNQSAIVALAGEDWYAYVEQWYGFLWQSLESGDLGGAVLIARAVER